jgi:hypothetical protein
MAGQLQPEVLLVDILLPGIDGATLITGLRSHAQFKHSRLIVITSLDEVNSCEPYSLRAGRRAGGAQDAQLVTDLPPLGPGLLAEALGSQAGRGTAFTMNRPRVLLVDDDRVDPPLRCAGTGRTAEVDLVEVRRRGRRPATALAAGAVRPDHHRPDDARRDRCWTCCVQHQADHPAQRGAARVAVFSAGLTAAMQSRLDTFDVWRQLSKPISLTALEDCVREAVVARSAAPADAKSACAAGDESLSDDERAAIDRHFGGEQALFIAFRASCRAQFAADLQAGDAAVASGDAAALRRLAHSLKSVLATLGHPGPGATARTLEDAAAAADWASATPLWQRLRAHLTSGG